MERAFQFDERLRARGAEDLGFLGIGPEERPLAVVVVIWMVFGRFARKGKHPEVEKSQANVPMTFNLVFGGEDLRAGWVALKWEIHAFEVLIGWYPRKNQGMREDV